MFITNATASVTRACFMSIIVLGGKSHNNSKQKYRIMQKSTNRRNFSETKKHVNIVKIGIRKETNFFEL